MGYVKPHMAFQPSPVSSWNKIFYTPHTLGKVASTSLGQFKLTQFLEVIVKTAVYCLSWSAPSLERLKTLQGMITSTKNIGAGIKPSNSLQRLWDKWHDKKVEKFAVAEITSEFVNDCSNVVYLLSALKIVVLKGLFQRVFAIWSIGSYFAKEGFGLAKTYLINDGEQGKCKQIEKDCKVNGKVAIYNEKQAMDYYVNLPENHMLNIIKMVKNISALLFITFIAFNTFTTLVVPSGLVLFANAVSVVMSLWTEFYKNSLSKELLGKA